MRTPPPKDGSPWIIPPDEAKGMYVHTANGPAPLADHFPKSKLREDQYNALPPKRWSPGGPR